MRIMTENKNAPDVWLVLWYNAKFDQDLQEDYATEADAFDAARSYSAQYPWNTYTVVRVMGEFPATAPLPSPTVRKLTPQKDAIVTVALGPCGGGGGGSTRQEQTS